jgi:hypothetical protein
LLESGTFYFALTRKTEQTLSVSTPGILPLDASAEAIFHSTSLRRWFGAGFVAAFVSTAGRGGWLASVPFGESASTAC